MMKSSVAYGVLGLLAASMPAGVAFGGGFDFEATGAGGPITDEGIGVFPVVISPKVNIATLEVVVNDLSHQFPEDLDLYLISPFGTYIELMTDLGGDVPVSNVDLLFRDGGSGIPGTPLTSNLDPGYQPEGLFNATDGGFSTFSGNSSGLGAWILLAIDDAPEDTGSIGSVTLRGTVPEPGVLSLLALGALALWHRRRSNQA